MKELFTLIVILAIILLLLAGVYSVMMSGDGFEIMQSAASTMRTMAQP